MFTAGLNRLKAAACPEVSACLLTPSAHYARTLSLGRVTPIHSEGWFRRCTVQVRPEPSAKVERILFVLHVLQLLLGLGRRAALL